jgi:hypothetical protein
MSVRVPDLRATTGPNDFATPRSTSAADAAGAGVSATIGLSIEDNETIQVRGRFRL